MNEQTTFTADKSSSNTILEAGPRAVPEADDQPGVATTLGDLVTALQDVTDDDQLVLAVMTDLMRRGALKRPDTGSVH